MIRIFFPAASRSITHKEARVKSTKVGFEATGYELTAKAYLALTLDSINLDDLLNRIDEEATLEILAAILTT